MSPGRMASLQDDELLRELEEVRYLSPVIRELCRRLELYVDKPEPVSGRAECPVCQADLRCDYDYANEILSLQVNT